MKKIEQFLQWLIAQDLRFVHDTSNKFHILHPILGVPMYTVNIETEQMDSKPPSDNTKTVVGMSRIKRTIVEEYEKILAQPNELRAAFLTQWRACKDMDLQVVVAAVKLPTGAIETITNYTDLQSKLRYYKEAYDSHFRLKNNPQVQIVGLLIV